MPVLGRDIALAVLAAFIWGATFPITRAGLDETPPLLFAALRFAAAALFIVVVPRPKVPWRWLLAVGCLFGVGQFGFLFVAMENGIPPGLASLLVHTQALFTIAIAWVIFSERLNRRQWLAITLAATGLLVMILDRASPINLFGFALALLAGCCGAGGNNVLKLLGDADKVGVAVWMSVAAPIPLLVLSVLFDPGTLTANLAAVGWQTAAAVAYSAVLATIAGFAIWGILLTRYPASTVAPFFLLVPVFGIGLSVILLNEMLSPLRLLGCGLVFAGLLVTISYSTR